MFRTFFFTFYVNKKKKMQNFIELLNSNDGLRNGLTSAMSESTRTKELHYSAKLKDWADKIILYQDESIRKLCSYGFMKANMYFEKFGILYSYNLKTEEVIRVDKDIFGTVTDQKSIDAAKTEKDFSFRKLITHKSKALLRDLDRKKDEIIEKMGTLEKGVAVRPEHKSYKQELAEQLEQVFKSRRIINTLGIVNVENTPLESSGPLPMAVDSEQKATKKRKKDESRTAEITELDYFHKLIGLPVIMTLEEYIDSPPYDDEKKYSKKEQCRALPNSEQIIYGSSSESDTSIKLLESYSNAVKQRDKIKSLMTLIKNQKSKSANDRFQAVIASLRALDDQIRGGARDNIKENVVKFVKSFINAPNQFKERYLNFALLGPAGSGKTSVANCLGDVLKSLGILVSGNMTQHSRATLVGQYIGETSSKTLDALISNLEGVMFIDEAYAITQAGDSGGVSQENKFDQYGIECINEIVGFLDKNRGKICVIVAGYQKQMKDYFFGVNSGLQRRFPEQWILKDYSADDLWEILYSKVKKANSDKENVLTCQANNVLYCYIKTKPDSFINQAGDMENLADLITLTYNSNQSFLTEDQIMPMLQKLLNLSQDNCKTLRDIVDKCLRLKNDDWKNRLKLADCKNNSM